MVLQVNNIVRMIPYESIDHPVCLSSTLTGSVGEMFKERTPVLFTNIEIIKSKTLVIASGFDFHLTTGGDGKTIFHIRIPGQQIQIMCCLHPFVIRLEEAQSPSKTTSPGFIVNSPFIVPV